jgi:hypothetical protein
LTGWAVGALSDALIFASSFVENPVSAVGEEFGSVCDLINRNKADSESTGRSCFVTFIRPSNVAETMKVTAVIPRWVVLPRTFCKFHAVTVGEPGIVFDDEGIGANVESTGRCAEGVVSVLEQLVGERGIPLEISKFGTEVLEVIYASVEILKLGRRIWH